MQIQRLLFIVLTSLTAANAMAGNPTGTSPAGAARRELAAIENLTPDPGRGKALFERCGTCHGNPDPSFPKGWVPRIAGQHPRVIEKELVDYRHKLRWDARMEVVAGEHILGAGQDIADVAAYAGQAPRPAPQTGDGEHLELGRQQYRTACVACHGAAGGGSNAHVIPQLAGQDYGYLLRQLHDTLEGRRPSMPVPHARLFKPMGIEELEGLADYLSRLPPREVAEHPPALHAQR